MRRNGEMTVVNICPVDIQVDASVGNGSLHTTAENVRETRKNRAFETYISYKGELKRLDRFKAGHLGDLIVTARLKNEYYTTDKRTNSIKIMNQLRKDGIVHEAVIDNSFTAADITFDDMVKANRILDLTDKEDRRVTYAITNRNAKCKGVITSWDEPISELGEALDNFANVLMLERLRKKIYDEKKKEYYWEATKHVVITLRGNVLPKELSIWGVAALPVRPFVDPVIQCFHCYKFGH